MMVLCSQRLQLEYAKDNYRIELPRTEVELLATKVRCRAAQVSLCPT